MEESDFVNAKGRNLWVIGAKNNVTLNNRLDIFKTKTEENCKLFIYNYIKQGLDIILK